MVASFYLFSLVFLLGLSLIGFGFGLDIQSHRQSRYKIVAFVALGTALYSAGLHLLLIPEKGLILTVLLSSLGIFIALSPLLFLKQTSRVLGDFNEENQILIKQQLDEGVVDIPAGIHDSKWNYEISGGAAKSEAQTIKVGEGQSNESSCGWCDWSASNPLLIVGRIKGDGFRQFICPECMMELKEPSTWARNLLMMAVIVIGGGGLTLIFVMSSLS